MHKVSILNQFSPLGLQQLDTNHYSISLGEITPDCEMLLVRSALLYNIKLPKSLKVVGRAGIGVDNIPVAELTQRGIPVLNTPGANANAVKELVLAGMLLAARRLCSAWQFTKNLSLPQSELEQAVEKQKKAFVGHEISGKTLGVIGLGAIGVKVANAALSLGMRVIGYDPEISVQRAWELSAGVEQAKTLESLLAQTDYISCHVPLTEKTKHLINSKRLATMKAGVILLNFARADIIEESALIAALREEKVSAYVCDFPAESLQTLNSVIALPHLGASTKEAEENCARMVIRHAKEFIESGNIINSINFPEVVLPRGSAHRICIVNANIPNMLGQVSTKLAQFDYNIIDMMNKSKENMAYTLIDVEKPVSSEVISSIQAIAGIISVWVIEANQ
ncbi:MAG: 3-phosphoglycerate dehydrogenase [Gammaproteobacteria bacterium RIFCSPHIGHO2_12_FULL_35_23]|nr:MAG: 3-phosphoglycerate dehydrogenase [Gammaproteobacteria bacterium RIFCSPHIGHO2_12_FULL_35_23]